MLESESGDSLVACWLVLPLAPPPCLPKRCRHCCPRFGEDIPQFIQCANNTKTGGTANTKTETGCKMIFIDQRSGPSLTEQNVAGINVKFYKSQN